jgi:hypothetical protein
MLREWWERGIADGATFRRRMRSALAISVLAEVALIVAVVIRYSP